MISRTTMSCAQSARAAAAASGSIARRVPSDPTPSRPPCAAQPAARSRTPSRSPCSSEHAGKPQESLPIGGGKSAHCGRRSQTRRPAGSGGTAPARPIAYALSSGRMTRVHPTPAQVARLPKASRRVRAARLPFFNPAGDGVPRDAESAREPAQGTAFVVSSEYLFTL